MNITYTVVNVNKIPQKKLQEILLDGYLYKINPIIHPKRWLCDLENKIYLPYFGTEKRYSNCVFDVKANATTDIPVYTHHKRTPATERFKVMSKYHQEKFIPDHILECIKEIQLSTATVISINKNYHEWFTIKTKVKGCPVYNHQLADKALEDGKAFSQKNPWVYFLTLTYDFNNLGSDRVFANKYFKEEKQKVIKKLKRKFGVEVQSFTEVTNRGYPHAHLVIYSPRPLCGEKSPPKTVKKIKRGILFDTVKTSITSPVFDLRKATSAKVAGYLVKYIAKSTKTNPESEKGRNGKLSAKKRKELMTNFFPCVYSYRAYSSTFRKRKSPHETDKASLQDFCAEVKQTSRKSNLSPEDTFLMMDEAARRAANLIVFRIKENTNCGQKVFFIKKDPKKPFNKAWYGKSQGKYPSATAEGHLKMCPISCNGCPFRQFIGNNPDFVKSPEKFITFYPFFTEGEFLQHILYIKEVEEQEYKEARRVYFQRLKTYLSQETIKNIREEMTLDEWFWSGRYLRGFNNPNFIPSFDINKYGKVVVHSDIRYLEY